MGMVYFVQHAGKRIQAGDPGLTLAEAKAAEKVAEYLTGQDVRFLYSSPAQRAYETAEIIGERLGLVVVPDARLRERVDWDATIPREQFDAEWDRSNADRDYQPENGFTSRQVGDRMLEYAGEMAGAEGTVVAVTHGGATVDMLRTLLGDRAVPDRLLHEGPEPTAITTFDHGSVLAMALPPPWV